MQDQPGPELPQRPDALEPRSERRSVGEVRRVAPATDRESPLEDLSQFVQREVHNVGLTLLAEEMRHRPELWARAYAMALDAAGGDAARALAVMDEFVGRASHKPGADS